uniref:Methyltransferase type 11 domain-containing protein n=1 Tax=Brassica oleracea var. oleracea TaxID=109376 RepID=A0A0D3AN39_BRAOL
MLGVESEEAQGILPLNLVPNALASRSVPFKPREPMISPPLNHSLIRCLLVHSTILYAESDLTETPLDRVSFQVADALEQPFEDGIFDLVWSMESGEHMPDKAKFVKELVRVAAPGGRIIIVTWCHRNLSQGEEALQPWEQNLLDRICKTFYLPAWCSTSDYVDLLQSLSLQDIKCADWSENVAPFWPAVIRTALTWKGLVSLLRSGMKSIKGALTMPLMIEGYKKGVIKFGIITCQKPL